MNPGHELQTLVSAFADEIVGLAKGEAMRQVAAAFGVHTRNERPATPRSPASGRRSAAALGDLKAKILEHVAANPGLRMEQLNSTLGTSTKALVRPIRQLVSEGSLKTEGERRGMKYYASGKTKKAPRAGKRRKARSSAAKGRRSKDKEDAPTQAHAPANGAAETSQVTDARFPA